MMDIIELLANSKNYGAARLTSAIKYIVWHYTANRGDTAKNNAVYFRNNTTGTSAHEFIDKTSIYLSVPHSRIAYSVGGSKYTGGGGSLYGVCKNYNSISIELCDSVDGIPEETLRLAILRTRELIDMYNVPIENVIRHYDVTGKICPKPLIDDGEWRRVKKMIVEEEIDMEELEKLKTRVEELEAKHKVYNHIDSDMPEWMRDITGWALAKGIISGTGAGLGMTVQKAETLVMVKNAYNI